MATQEEFAASLAALDATTTQVGQTIIANYAKMETEIKDAQAAGQPIDWGKYAAQAQAINDKLTAINATNPHGETPAPEAPAGAPETAPADGTVADAGTSAGADNAPAGDTTNAQGDSNAAA